MRGGLDAAKWHEACGRRDPEAWERLNGFLLALARKIALTLDDADRQDVVQRVLLEAWLSHARLEPAAWIPNTVLRLGHRVVDLHRRRSASPEFLPDDPDAVSTWGVAAPDNPEKRACLRQTLRVVFDTAFEHLGERCTRLLDLYFRMKAGSDPALQTLDDVAKRFEITTNNASVSIHRCIKELMAVPRVAEALDGVAGR